MTLYIRKDMAMQKIRKKLADAWGIPESVVMNIPLVTVQGNSGMRIENYKNIILYTENEIQILSKEMIITVYGKGLSIDTINSESLFISGSFEKIEYKE